MKQYIITYDGTDSRYAGERCEVAANGLRLGGRFNAAKPLLYEVPTYLAGCQIETINRKTKRKKEGWN